MHTMRLLRLRRSDFVPRLTYASVEGMFLELVDASPVRRHVHCFYSPPSCNDFSAWHARTTLGTGSNALCRAAQGVRSTFAQTFEGIRSATWGAKPKSPSAAETSTASHLQGTLACIAVMSSGVHGCRPTTCPCLFRCLPCHMKGRAQHMELLRQPVLWQMQWPVPCAGLADVSDLAGAPEAAERAARTAESAMRPDSRSASGTGLRSPYATCTLQPVVRHFTKLHRG